jgi:hypothetical protein
MEGLLRFVLEQTSAPIRLYLQADCRLKLEKYEKDHEGKQATGSSAKVRGTLLSEIKREPSHFYEYSRIRHLNRRLMLTFVKAVCDRRP